MVTGVQGIQTGGCIGNIGAIPRLNFTGICMLDGPQAINRADLVSVFPAGVLAGAPLFMRGGRLMGMGFGARGGIFNLGRQASHSNLAFVVISSFFMFSFRRMLTTTLLLYTLGRPPWTSRLGRAELGGILSMVGTRDSSQECRETIYKTEP
jgi:hypothetical protein